MKPVGKNTRKSVVWVTHLNFGFIFNDIFMPGGTVNQCHLTPPRLGAGIPALCVCWGGDFIININLWIYLPSKYKNAVKFEPLCLAVFPFSSMRKQSSLCMLQVTGSGKCHHCLSWASESPGNVSWHFWYFACIPACPGWCPNIS